MLILLAGAGTYGYYFWRELQAKKEQEMKAAEDYLAQRRAEDDAIRRAQANPPASTPSPPQTPAASPPPTPPAAAPEAPPPAKKDEARERRYKVRHGDTLWKIAKMPEHFGKGHRWYDIWKANEDEIQDFDYLIAGQTLVIPLDKPDGYGWPRTSEERKELILSQPRRRYRSSATN